MKAISVKNKPAVSIKVAKKVAEVQAAYHRETRAAHGQELAEDYVEVVADLISALGEARAVDIAKRLGVTHVTVTKNISRLARRGLISTKPYRAIFLTPAGERLAAQCKRRHQAVVDFLISLGIHEDTANTDAEGIEHHVSSETLQAFIRNTKHNR